MALASDWDEVRRGVQLNILFGAAVCATLIAFSAQFDFTRMPTLFYAMSAVLMTVAMAFFYWRQEKVRPR